jgi:hypothetical protein
MPTSWQGRQDADENVTVIGSKELLRSVRDFARKEWPLRGSMADVLI